MHNSSKRNHMSFIKAIVIAGSLSMAASVLAAESPALAKLQGKWSGKRTNSEGREMITTIEFKGEKFTFQTFNADQELRLIARGDVKVEMAGPFSVLKLTGIEGGRSASEMQSTGDDRSSVYVVRGDTLTMASGFDKDRDNERPRVEVFQRVEAKESTASGDMGKLTGKWKLTAKLGEDERDYELNLAEADGKLSGTLVSPRTGEYKFKSITWSNGKLAMELPREIEGNSMTFVYTGELKGSELAGKLTIKGYEEQFTGTWTAKK
jgi:hypothetical protein